MDGLIYHRSGEIVTILGPQRLWKATFLRGAEGLRNQMLAPLPVEKCTPMVPTT